VGGNLGKIDAGLARHGLRGMIRLAVIRKIFYRKLALTPLIFSLTSEIGSDPINWETGHNVFYCGCAGRYVSLVGVEISRTLTP
jgi:hypothetical protein